MLTETLDLLNYSKKAKLMKIRLITISALEGLSYDITHNSLQYVYRSTKIEKV